VTVNCVEIFETLTKFFSNQLLGCCILLLANLQLLLSCCRMWRWETVLKYFNTEFSTETTACWQTA